ncbi:MAG: Fic family protein [Flavobacteriales bacterium]|nr:Fic family protein [Flavobacteriales bacterium]
MQLLPADHLPAYRSALPFALEDALAELVEAVNGGTSELMRLYESAVCSSQIEGSKVTLNVFKETLDAVGDGPKPRDVQEVADLVEAYRFAQAHELNAANLLHAHCILSNLLVHGNDQGAWRSKGVKVGNAYTTVYLAPHQSMVPGLMEQLFQEVAALNSGTLATDEAFYFASMLHLAFVDVHPFIDGNGRTARLLEKWFLARHIGPLALSIRSEKYIINHRDEYYDALRAIGPQWGSLDLSRSIPFLVLLPKAVQYK